MKGPQEPKHITIISFVRSSLSPLSVLGREPCGARILRSWRHTVPVTAPSNYGPGRCTRWLQILSLQFPNAVALNAVGRSNTQMSAKERSAKERKRKPAEGRKIRVSEGREWGVGSVVVESAFLGRPDFQSRGPQNPCFEGFRSDLGQKSGAPQTQIQRPRIQRPILGPLRVVETVVLENSVFVPCRKHVALTNISKILIVLLRPGNRRKWRVPPRQNDRLPKAPF